MMKRATVRLFSTKPKPFDSDVLVIMNRELNSVETKTALNKFHEEYKTYYSSTEKPYYQRMFEATLMVGFFYGVVFIGPDLHSDWRMKKREELHHQKELRKAELDKLRKD